jgi:hypothetical protein
MIIISLVLIRYSREGRAWSFAGASVVGAFGVALRLVVSTQPGLEVGGGLPAWVSVLYVLIGVLVSVFNLASVLELRRIGREP